jgi:hypothetical protein
MEKIQARIARVGICVQSDILKASDGVVLKAIGKANNTLSIALKR